MLEHCTLCPRMCGANRKAGERGFCGADAQIRVGLAYLHQWEEPCLSGTKGAGTVFFCHCPLGCVYCQNHDISGTGAQPSGIYTDVSGLADTFLSLQQRGAHNIDLVTPTHYAAQLTEAIPLARERGLTIPIVYNCGGYERVETLRMLDGLIDIYLPDFKYYSSYYSERYSHVSDYFDVAVDAIDEMVRQTAEPVIDSDGLMRSGTIIRHLMLPGLGSDTAHILRTIAKRWKTDVFVSLMRQFTPCTDLTDYPELMHPITDEAYAEACEEMAFLGLDGWTQEAEAISESFIPHFDGTGVCPVK
ncbi:radical SAM protein [Butyricicoccus sp.]|uniref:radical SAM protein n=1 Tax=Butyricicoccus sp. TaxID=2049021 RepID=UPI003D7E67CD